MTDTQWGFDDGFAGGVWFGLNALGADEDEIRDFSQEFKVPNPEDVVDPFNDVFFTANYETGAAIKANGSGLTYDTSGPDTIVTGGTVDSLEFLDRDGTTVMVTLSGFGPVVATDVFDAIAAGSINILFDFLVGLVDGDTTVTGTNNTNAVFVGAGDDTADMGGGNDAIAKFSAGNLTYDGGAGSDTLSFNKELGFAPPDPQIQQLVVDLTAGTGQNPFGGTLTLTSVENVAGIVGGADITGSDADNFIGDPGLGGGTFESIIGATIDTLGGNDTIAFSNFSNSSADGGGGTDTVAFESFGGTHTLDLANQANNAGAFSGSTFTNFETYELSVISGGTLNFTGTNQADNLTIEGNSTFDIAMGGDDDTLTTLDFTDPTFSDPSISADVDGGAGTDTLIFRQGVGTNVLDLANPANNTGPFTGRTFTNFETFETLLQGSNGILDFRGDGNANTVRGGNGADILDGGKGKDTLDGGGGNDTLIGAKKKDKLFGDDGTDRFVFASIKDSSTKKKKADIIKDFSRSENDLIDLSAIDAKKGGGNQDFKWIGKSKFHDKKGELHYVKKKGFVIVEADVKGNGKADFAIKVDDIGKLVADDFVL